MVEKAKSRRNLQLMRERVHHLSQQEIAALRQFIWNNSRSAYFEYSDGVINGLVARGVVYRASNASAYHMRFAYNLQPWACDYLNRHPELLADPDDIQSPP